MAEIVIILTIAIVIYALISSGKKREQEKAQQDIIDSTYIGLSLDGTVCKVHYLPEDEVFMISEQQIILDSDKIIRKSKNLETITSRIDVLNSSINNLYE